jgi:hypothetical protein
VTGYKNSPDYGGPSLGEWFWRAWHRLRGNAENQRPQSLDDLEPEGPIKELLRAIQEQSRIDPDQRRDLQAKLIEHLERAQAITDLLGLDQTGYLVERALDDARAVHWPHLDPNVEAFRQPPKTRPDGV